MSLILALTLLFHLNTQSVSLPLIDPELIDNVNVTYQFARSIDITAEVPEMSAVSQVNIYFQTDTGARLQTSATVTSDGKLTGYLNLLNSPYKVFDRIYYWFEITYTDGQKAITPSYWFDYYDNRFTWQRSETKWFIVYNIPSSPISADEIQSIALSSLKYATKILAVSPELPMVLYVYPDVDSLSSALGMTSSEWAAAEARPEIGVIMVSTSDNGDEKQDLERQIPHELTHILEYAITGDDYTNAPKWLLEGLATLAENSEDKTDQRLLADAHREGELLPLSEICSSFPPEYSRSALAYAESASFVRYLRQTYGNDSLITLLENSANAANCDQLMQATYGKDLTTLESDWIGTTLMLSIVNRSSIEYWLLVLVIPVVLLGLWRIKRHGSVKMEGETKDE